MDRLEISVIIATRAASALLPTALAHLDVQTYPASGFEVIVAEYGGDESSELDRYLEGTAMRARCVHSGGANMCMALNRAAEAAQGRSLLFLDEDLCAGSHLVEGHIRALEHRGNKAAISGGLARHPQAPLGRFTKWGYLPSEPRAGANLPFNILQWRVANLSVPRDIFREVGGFDEGYVNGGLFDVDLAWRLGRSGMPGYYEASATAYGIESADLAAEEQRNYYVGYSLHRLAERTQSPAAIEFLLRYGGGLNSGIWGPLLPVARGICRHLDEDSSLFARVFPRVLRYRLTQGYRDAQAGLPPRHVAGDVPQTHRQSAGHVHPPLDGV
jgi:hypothetical protein